MAKITLTDLGTLTGLSGSAVLAINNNNTSLETAIENTLSRDGTAPNAMNADLDMNTNDVLNAGIVGATTVNATTTTTTTLNASTIFIDGTELDVAGITGPAGPAGAAGVGVPVGGTTGQALVKASNTNYDTTWSTVSGSVSDGDKGDIVVSGTGTVWSIDTGVIVNADVNAAAAIDATKIADGSVTNAEFQYIGTLSSNAQTQLDAKAPLASPTFTGTVTIPTPFTLGAVSVLPTGTELNFVDGVTSSIQTQLDGKQALDADLTSWAGVTRAAGFDTFVATPSSANLAALVTDETGTGALVFATSPTLVTPALGTPASGVMTNVTGTATGLTSGITNALKSATTTVDVSAATAPTSGQVLTATAGTTATWQTPASGGFTAATQAEQETGSSTTVGTTPGRQQFHPSAAKCWGKVTGGGTPSLVASYNVTSITDTAVGQLTVTIATDFSSADYSISVATGQPDSGTHLTASVSTTSVPAVGSFLLNSNTGGGALTDPVHWYFEAFGDQ